MMVSDAITLEKVPRLDFIRGGVTNDAHRSSKGPSRSHLPMLRPSRRDRHKKLHRDLHRRCQRRRRGRKRSGRIARSGPSSGQTGSLRLSSSPWLVGWLA